MANYQLLKADIDAKVYQNGKQEITGENLNYVLNQMVTTLGAEYQFAGVATINTNPGTPDAKVFYIANGKGTYTNFSNLEVTEDEVVVLYWDTAWHKEETGIASQAKLTELESEVSQLGQSVNNKIISIVGIGYNSADAGVTGDDQYYYNYNTNKIVHVINYQGGISEQITPQKNSLYTLDNYVYVYDGTTLVKNGEIITELYDKDALIRGYYYLSSNGSLNEYGYWNATPLIPIDLKYKYYYNGYTRVGGTTAICFYKGNTNLTDDFISSVIPEVGKEVELEMPQGAKYVGFSVHDDDINNIRIYAVQSPATMEDVLGNIGKLYHINIKQLPSIKATDCIIVNRPYSGLAFSDGHVFRWAKDNNLVISANQYKTTKLDNSEIAGVNDSVVSEAYSMTKLLSALTAERYCGNNWNTTIELNARDCHWDFGVDFIKEGDVATLITLLNSSLVQSDNNAAQALSRAIGYIIAGDSSISDDDALYYFRAKMQETATLVGMSNSVIDNTTYAFDGLKTTPDDMCKLVAYIENKSTIVKNIWGLLNYTIEVTGNNARTWQITSTTTQSARELLPEFVGGKTGSGSTFGTYAIIWQSNGIKYASCLMDFSLTNGDRFQDMRHIIDEAKSLI